MKKLFLLSTLTLLAGGQAFAMEGIKSYYNDLKNGAILKGALDYTVKLPWTLSKNIYNETFKAQENNNNEGLEGENVKSKPTSYTLKGLGVFGLVAVFAYILPWYVDAIKGFNLNTVYRFTEIETGKEFTKEWTRPQIVEFFQSLRKN